MSARKLDRSKSPKPVVVKSRQTILALAPAAVRVRRNGIEFRSEAAFQPWVEMTVELESPKDGQTIRCHGIVVACDGSRHTGYLVSLLFSGLTAEAQQHLQQLAIS